MCRAGVIGAIAEVPFGGGTFTWDPGDDPNHTSEGRLKAQGASPAIDLNAFDVFKGKQGEVHPTGAAGIEGGVVEHDVDVIHPEASNPNGGERAHSAGASQVDPGELLDGVRQGLTATA